MRIVTKHINYSPREELLTAIAPLSDFLFLDIETTGLSAEQNAIYLIGCAYCQSDGWDLIQWMDTSGKEEKEILSSFLLFASGYRYLVHYNGDRFDLPFLKKRLQAHSLQDLTEQVQSLDLYKAVVPYRRLLGLPDYKQQTMEALLDTGRPEGESGGDLVPSHRVLLIGVEEAEDSVLPSGGLLLILRQRSLPLEVLLVQLADEDAACFVHFVRDVSVKNGLEIFTSSHGNILSALHALGGGHRPIIFCSFP